MHTPPKPPPVRVGELVLYTRDAEGSTFPAIVVRQYGAFGSLALCAFTPAAEAVWSADYDPAGTKPGTWRHLPPTA